MAAKGKTVAPFKVKMSMCIMHQQIQKDGELRFHLSFKLWKHHNIVRVIVDLSVSPIICLLFLAREIAQYVVHPFLVGRPNVLWSTSLDSKFHLFHLNIIGWLKVGNTKLDEIVSARKTRMLLGRVSRKGLTGSYQTLKRCLERCRIHPPRLFPQLLGQDRNRIACRADW